eukprot:PLAT13814.1.p1 GENE.PLAT13814.1~~PLAT13814.1.p1  ORF type:complete len:206 (+),score=66.50 PLAT13814.1:77-619(+)
MRPLTEDETMLLFEKLSKFIGKNIEALIEPAEEPACFRLHENRVYYMTESMMRKAAHFGRDDLACVGTCFGKFTKTGKFRLYITALDHLAALALHKVWVKSGSEMLFLYGNHVLKSGLARITEDVPRYAGVVVYNMSDIPLGFGVAAQSTEACRVMDPTGVVVLHQADIGEYLRIEDELS